ncbi:hypothetical protein K443DRAFT_118448 [Laccaria amethystina LaAM-08-1]|uniref:Uncharacterized protein n=1 Tax=Laccaria amethystina LaAM-08-1 TaxID=1095629 RepID=A0A0C9YN55_9AGAR|nr:hypothetical protein K443DRAFT_118448 [Laccaria amethystina LaAM-08-1]
MFADVSMFKSLRIGFFCSLLQTIQVLAYRAKQRQSILFSPMLLTALVLSLTITGNWLTESEEAYHAFILPSNLSCSNYSGLSHAEIAYLTLENPWNVANSALYVGSTLLGGGFMIYRLYIVWARNNYIIIPPALMSMSLAVTGSMVNYLFFRSAEAPIFATAGDYSLLHTDTHPHALSNMITERCNLYSTSLIAFKIYLPNRRLAQLHTERIGFNSAVLYRPIQSYKVTYFETQTVQGSIRNGRQGAGVKITTHSEKQVDSADPLDRFSGSNSSIISTELAGPSNDLA